jgi:translation initiation factor 4G
MSTPSNNEEAYASTPTPPVVKTTTKLRSTASAFVPNAKAAAFVPSFAMPPVVSSVASPSLKHTAPAFVPSFPSHVQQYFPPQQGYMMNHNVEFGMQNNTNPNGLEVPGNRSRSSSNQEEPVIQFGSHSPVTISKGKNSPVEKEDKTTNSVVKSSDSNNSTTTTNSNSNNSKDVTEKVVNEEVNAVVKEEPTWIKANTNAKVLQVTTTVESESADSSTTSTPSNDNNTPKGTLDKSSTKSSPNTHVNSFANPNPSLNNTPLSRNNSNNNISEGGGPGWKRGETVKVTVSTLLTRDDGIKRYEKHSLLSLFVKHKVVPEELRSQFPDSFLKERSPLMPKGMKIPGHSQSPRGGRHNDELPHHADEATIFKKNDPNTFKFVPGRLENVSDPEVVVQKANLILNKLSVTKFDKLSDEFMTVGIDTPDLMTRAVEMIVLKAQMEEHFCFMYADLCRKITDKWAEKDENGLELESETITNAEGDETKKVSLGKVFRERLLERCRDEFSIDRVKCLEDIRSLDVPIDVKEEKEIILKKRYTGHMRFIGELFIKDLVKATIMYTCIDELLGNVDEEENLVCMAKLLQTIGLKLEAYDNRKKRHNVATYFVSIKEKSETHPTSRMRFMLRDLIDMRKNNWTVRREQETAKSLDDLNADIADGVINGGNKTPKGSSNNLSGLSRSTSQDFRNQNSEATDDWQTVQSTIKAKKSGGGSNASSPRGNSAASSPRFSNNSTSKSSNNFNKTNGKPSQGSNNGNAKFNTSNGQRGGQTQGNKFDANKFGKNDNKNGKKNDSKESTPKDDDFSIIPIAIELPGQSGPVPKEDIDKIKSGVLEYLTNVIVEDSVTEFKELVHSNGMGDVIRAIILLVIDKREIDHENLTKLIVGLYNANNDDNEKFLSVSQTNKGILQIMNELDEISIDVPKASSILAKMLSTLIVENVFTLSCLSSEEAMENISKSADFISCLVSNLIRISDINTAIDVYKESGINLVSLVRPFPEQSIQDAVKEIVTKHDLPKEFEELLSFS